MNNDDTPIAHIPAELSDNILHRTILEDQTEPAGDVVLKPCPFHEEAGVLDIKLRSDYRRQEFYCVACGYCGGEGPKFYDRAEAITAWNTRATLTPSTPRWPGDPGPGAWVPAEHLAEANRKIAELSTPVASGEVGEMFDLTHQLIQEAKGAGGDADYVTNHLDDAENWLDKIESAYFKALNSSTPTPDPVGKIVAWRVDDLTSKGEVCDSFCIFVEHEKVEQYVARAGTRFTKVTPLYERGDWRDTPSDQGWREDGRKFRHKKRGTVYTLIGVGRAQGEMSDEDSVCLYRGEDGGLWVRHQLEFSDGRFEEVPADPRTQPTEDRPPDEFHPSHVVRASDASSFDIICENCGNTDITGGGWGNLAQPCPAQPTEDGSAER